MKKIFMHKILPIRSFLSLACTVLLMATFVVGCVSIPEFNIINPKSTEDFSSATIDDARKAWNSNEMLRVEKIYSHLLQAGSLDLPEQEEALQRLVVAADKNGNTNVTLTALDNWLKLNPRADNTKIWQNAWLNSVRVLPSSETIKRAEQVYSRSSSDGAYVQAVIILMGRYWQPRQSEKILYLLSNYYEMQDQIERIALERKLSNELRYLSFQNLQQLSYLGSKDFIFPYTIIMLEKARREVNQGKNRDAELAMISERLADKTLVKADMKDSNIDNSVPKPVEIPNKLPIQGSDEEVCIVLALPGQGPLDSISSKIKVGAYAAQQELINNGSKVIIQFINTNDANWLMQLDNLPEYCTVVGGPLQLTKYKEVKTSASIARKNIFAFTSQLEANDEGTIMWRFFPSAADQVNALLFFTKGQLGINDYGSFYPEDAYGFRMSHLFEQAVSVNSGMVKQKGYVQGDVATWLEHSKVLLDAYTVEDTVISGATFQAVFLPDSWKNMEMISTSLLFYGEDRQILMGTTLWEQGLSSGAGHEFSKYKLAIFPGVWDPSIVPPLLLNTYDLVFWNILGYDFVRFAYALNLKKYANGVELQNKLRSGENISWTMAPIRWDAQGIARQELIIFTPTETGFAPVDVEAFKSKWLNSIKGFDSRLKAILREQSKNKEAKQNTDLKSE